MRRIGDSDDKQVLQLLKEGADAVKNTGPLEARLKQAEEQISLLRYSLINILKTLQSYPLIRQQCEELDYRTLGMMKAIDSGLLVSPVGPVRIENFGEVVEEKARESRQEAFDELSVDDDARNNLVDASDEVITDQHTVIYSTTSKDANSIDIFRAKIAMLDPQFKEQRDGFLGKKVGDTFETKIQGKEHQATIHGIRKKKDESTPQQ